MSTRSYICVKQNDGSYKGVYCHWDGYLTYNGIMISNKKVLQLFTDVIAGRKIRKPKQLIWKRCNRVIRGSITYTFLRTDDGNILNTVNFPKG